MTRRTIVLAYWITMAACIGFFGQTRPAEAQAAYPPCLLVNAQITATNATEAPYVGLYKYTVSVTWDVGRHDPSHLDVLIGLQDCACVCDNRLFKFASPAGSSTGINAADVCTVPYIGSYVCKGDPSIKGLTTGPAIKFEPNEASCSTDETGTGTFVFYSPFPPSPFEVTPNAIAIKHGFDTCFGSLSGSVPVCECAVPTQGASWGQLKSFYR
jgi:hypothetical protein